MKSGIYEILNTVNGNRYIGSASNLKTRWVDHRKRLRGKRHHSRYLQRAWDKHGEAVFEFRVIQPCPKEQLLFQEQRAIHGFMPEYNVCCVAGSPIGIRHTAAQRAANAARQRGKKLSAETRAKIGAAQIGKILSVATRAKMSLVAKGRVISVATRKKMAAAKKGTRATPETRAKMSASHKGKSQGPLTDRHKAKLSLALIGKTYAPRGADARSNSTIAKYHENQARITWIYGVYA